MSEPQLRKKKIRLVVIYLLDLPIIVHPFDLLGLPYYNTKSFMTYHNTPGDLSSILSHLMLFDHIH